MTPMNGRMIQISYNSFSYRWEVWRSGESLPESTYASRDSALMVAVDLVRPARRARVVVFDEQGAPETVLDIQNAGIRPTRSLASFYASQQGRFNQQPSGE